jgi:hypothetical protein
MKEQRLVIVAVYLEDKEQGCVMVVMIRSEVKLRMEMCEKK